MARRTSRRQTGIRGRLLFFVRRFWLIPAGITVALWAFLFLWFGGGAAALADKAVSYTARNGFVVASVLVEGRVHADPEALKEAVFVKQGDPIFGFSLSEVRTRLEAIPWVQAARLERRLPDLLYIHIQERQPAALWQRDGALALVDGEGIVLADRGLERFAALPMVVGDNARFHARSLSEMIQAEPAIAARLESAVWVGDRRWTLYMKNGMTVLLPENDPETALRRVGEAQAHEKILDSPIVAEIDTRLSGKMVVRPRPAAALEPAAGGEGGSKTGKTR